MGLEFELCSQGCHDAVILVLCCAAWRTQLHSGQQCGVGTSMDCGQEREACGDYFYLGTNA